MATGAICIVRYVLGPISGKKQASLVLHADAQSDIVSGGGMVTSRAYFRGHSVILLCYKTAETSVNAGG